MWHTPEYMYTVCGYTSQLKKQSNGLESLFHGEIAGLRLEAWIPHACMHGLCDVKTRPTQPTSPRILATSIGILLSTQNATGWGTRESWHTQAWHILMSLCMLKIPSFFHETNSREKPWVLSSILQILSNSIQYEKISLEYFVALKIYHQYNELIIYL